MAFFDFKSTFPGVEQCSVHRFLFQDKFRMTGISAAAVDSNLIILNVVDSSLAHFLGIRARDVVLLPVGFTAEECLAPFTDLVKKKRPFMFEVVRPFKKMRNIPDGMNWD